MEQKLEQSTKEIDYEFHYGTKAYSTTIPLFFGGTNFSYWRTRVEFYLMKGFQFASDEEGKPLESNKWSLERKTKRFDKCKGHSHIIVWFSIGPFHNASEL